MAKDHIAIVRTLHDIEERITDIEAERQRFTFYTREQIDNERFDDTPFEVHEEERLSLDVRHGIMTLPLVESSSLSKLFYTNNDGEEVVPSTLEMRVVGTQDSADDTEALVDTAEPEYALYRKPGLVWERNVVVDTSHPNGAEMTLYVKVPDDLFTTRDANTLVVHPFPYFGSTIREVAYTMRFDPTLQESDGYTPFNSSAHYEGELDAVGWVAPGGWGGVNTGEDSAVDTGPRAFHFAPKPITAVKIRLHQPNHYQEAGRVIYSYGLSHLDLRFNKFLEDGRAMIKIDAPQGQTISRINDVQPQIWNVSPAVLSNVFDWRAIWETAPDSGVYTEDPIANSNRVWLEVTLRDTQRWTPSLSGLIIDYS